MPSQIYQLGFIGAGKLAGSVIRGLMRAKFCPPEKIIASWRYVLRKNCCMPRVIHLKQVPGFLLVLGFIPVWRSLVLWVTQV